MKKNIAILFLICFIVIIIIVVNFNNTQKVVREIKKINSQYEFYNKENLSGIDITTVINKAINHNEKYKVEKDENGIYINNKQNSIHIYVTMIINNKTYPMESINKLGMKDFTNYFGEIKFKCTNISYHEQTGKIATMTFESIQY